MKKVLMYHFPLAAVVLCLLTVVAAGCGGSGSSSKGTAGLNLSGKVTTLAGLANASADGTGIAASFNGPVSITSDGTNLYVADTSNHEIRKIVIATGVVSTLAGSITSGHADGTGSAASFNYPQGITIDSAGTTLYVSDTNNHMIRKIVIATGVVSTLAGSITSGHADGTGTAAGFNYPCGLATDGTNLYVADSSNNEIRKIVIATGDVTTFAGSTTKGSADGTGTAAGFNNPSGITIYGNNLYVADTSNNEIRKIVIDTVVVSTLAGNTTSGHADGTGTAAHFNFPNDMTIDSTGTNLYILDSRNHLIRKMVIATEAVSTLAGSTAGGHSDGTGAAASFYYPYGIIIDSTGTNLYVADSSNNEIRKIVVATGEVSTFAGLYKSADGTGTAARFRSPAGIASDGTNLYVTDGINHEIRKIVIATGAVSTLAGNPTSGHADGTGTAAGFDFPYGIIIDSTATNLYVTDSVNNEIRKIVIATGAVSTFAGSTTSGSADGTGSAASFYCPEGIASDGTNLYVTDRFNNEIRKIVIATGVVSTIAGSTTSGYADGTGTAASFYVPEGITCDGTNLYVADTANHEIRKIVIATGVVTTLAGSTIMGSVDGTGSAASFCKPYGITTDGTSLYVADTYNNEIRKIVIASGVVSTLAGSTTVGYADGTGTAVGFNYPQGITADGTSLYVADTKNNTIRVIK
jgi:DNA-binding beta-propeller fold protein YncE